jgi:D-serine deaminase-like pyridoxal phosphate-dependent protein
MPYDQSHLLGMSLVDIDTPAAIVDLDRLEANIGRMAQFTAQHGVALRPHAKSHKSAAIAARQRAAGATGLTVAKLDEAEAFLDAGFADLFIANEVVGARKWARLVALAQRGSIAVGVDNLEVARGLAETARQAGTSVDVMIEVDSGLRRAGVLAGEATLALAEPLAALTGLYLRGIFTHAGHAYGAASPAEVARIGRAEGETLVATAELLRAHGIACPVVSVGSTPTALSAGAVPGVTELRSGNYVFYDRMQVALGSASPGDCALTVLATVSSCPAADRAVVDTGSKTLALDRGAHGIESMAGYGEDLETGYILDHLSEEHGVIAVHAGQSAPRVGQRLRVLPNHACTVANLAECLLGVRGDRVVEILPIIARGGGR